MLTMHIPILAAPTASGKSSIALELAQEFPLAIISADAMMVYKGMDIGTAKPSLKEREDVPHFLIDVAKPDETFSVADFVPLAEKAIRHCLDKGLIPLIVGGTGFYIRALTQGLPTVPAADMQHQAPLWQRYEQAGLEPLLAELSRLSPQDAKRSQRNPRRVIRALEIIERTGKPPYSFPKTTPAFCYDTYILLPTMDSLEPRILARTEDMFVQGLVKEVQSLLKAYPKLATARQAIGYKEVIAYLNEEISLEESKQAIALATRQYAKRQHTWFRKESATTFPGLAYQARDTLRTWLQTFTSS